MVTAARIEKPSVHTEKAAARVENLLERQKEAAPSCTAHGAIHADFPAQDKHPALKIMCNLTHSTACGTLRSAAEFFGHFVEFRAAELRPGLM